MKYFIIAGEASGDLHGANLMRAIKERDQHAEFCFLGGDNMSAVGGRCVIHIRQMAFMGIVNVLLNLRQIKYNFKVCKQSLIHYQPDCVILVDYPGFNLKMAQFVKEQLKCPVYYYIAPKLWAWKSYRIKSMKRYVDRCFTIFPFETEFFARFNYPVEYVGNPTVDSVSSYMSITPYDTLFSQKHQLDKRPIVALLAGSRKQEIKGCLPKMISLSKLFPFYQFVVAAAPGVEADFYLNCGVEHIVFGETYELLRHSVAAIVNSGTATLETALLKTPQVVVYHVFGGFMASIVKEVIIKIPYVSLVNLVAGHKVVEELLAHRFTVSNMRNELERLLHSSDYVATQKHEYDLLIDKLGAPGAAQRTAHKIINLLTC